MDWLKLKIGKFANERCLNETLKILKTTQSKSNFYILLFKIWMLKRYKFNVEIEDKNTFCMKFRI